MKISVKTLKNDIFHVEADASDTVQVLKEKIQNERSDSPADRQKLIFSGKVLKDTQTIEEIGIGENDFLVCMVTQPKAASKPAPTPAPVSQPASTPAPTTTSTDTTASIQATTPATTTPAPAPATTTPGPDSEVFQNLVGMGYPEDQVRAALTAARGNGDVAFEFLNNGIPDYALAAAQQGRGAAPTGGSPAPTPGIGIEQLRLHPQFNELKRLIQTNPASLPQVLTLIGQQNRGLLEAIHAEGGEAAFLAMMNEPIVDAPAPSGPVPGMGGMGGMGGMNPAALLGQLATMPPQQRAMLAQQLNMTPEGLTQMMQVIAQAPPELLASLGAAGGMPGMPGMPGGMGGAAAPNVIRLTENEMVSVNNLVALGFTQQQAAQAFLACDRDEGLAANLLFDGFFDDGGAGYGGGGLGPGGGHDHGPDDDMYN